MFSSQPQDNRSLETAKLQIQGYLSQHDVNGQRIIYSLFRRMETSQVLTLANLDILIKNIAPLLTSLSDDEKKKLFDKIMTCLNHLSMTRYLDDDLVATVFSNVHQIDAIQNALSLTYKLHFSPLYNQFLVAIAGSAAPGQRDIVKSLVYLLRAGILNNKNEEKIYDHYRHVGVLEKLLGLMLDFDLLTQPHYDIVIANMNKAPILLSSLVSIVGKVKPGEEKSAVSQQLAGLINTLDTIDVDYVPQQQAEVQATLCSNNRLVELLGTVEPEMQTLYSHICELMPEEQVNTIIQSLDLARLLNADTFKLLIHSINKLHASVSNADFNYQIKELPVVIETLCNENKFYTDEHEYGSKLFDVLMGNLSEIEKIRWMIECLQNDWNKGWRTGCMIYNYHASRLIELMKCKPLQMARLRYFSKIQFDISNLQELPSNQQLADNLNKVLDNIEQMHVICDILEILRCYELLTQNNFDLVLSNVDKAKEILDVYNIIVKEHKDLSDKQHSALYLQKIKCILEELKSAVAVVNVTGVANSSLNQEPTAEETVAAEAATFAAPLANTNSIASNGTVMAAHGMFRPVETAKTPAVETPASPSLYGWLMSCRIL